MILPDRDRIWYQGVNPVDAFYRGVSVYGAAPVDPNPDPDPGDGDFAQPPATVGGPTTTSDGNFVSDAASVPAGRHILLPSGTYSGRTINFVNGTTDLPIIVRPENAGSPPVLRGTWIITGGNVEFWGIRFQQVAPSAVGSRALRFQATNIWLKYCDVEPRGIGVELRNSSATNCGVYRCLFDGSDQVGVSGANGYEAIKGGASGLYATDLNFQALITKFKTFDKEREAIKMASAGMYFYRCQAVNCSDISFRDCTGCSLEECDWGSSRMNIWGENHRVDNCKAGRIDVCRGNLPADGPSTGAGSQYMAADNAILRHNVCTGLYIGVDRGWGATWSYQATNTKLLGNTATPVSQNGATWSTAAAYPAATPKTVNDGDVGLAGYVSRVTV